MAFKLFNHNNNKYVYLSELGTHYDLSFSSHMVLADKIIALDGVKRKLIVAGFMETPGFAEVIDLNKIKTISLKKTYEGIDAGELQSKAVDEFITSIHLEFEHRHCGTVNSLVFYRNNLHIIHDLAKHERNAKSWQIILSKLINNGKENTGGLLPDQN
ncbi:MAG: hypothetical protein WDO19_02075 [Bacteroidota bacterium]